MAKKLSLVKQVEKIQNDRTYLRSGIETLIVVARDFPGAIKPSVTKQLQEMLDHTADGDES